METRLEPSDREETAFIGSSELRKLGADGPYRIPFC
jgi:hypothetical protein